MTHSDDQLTPPPDFHLGGAQAEYVEVWILSRSEADDYWDGNWLDCEVRLASGGFLARFSANLRTDEFRRFADELRTLYQDLKGTARFESTEEQLQLVLEGDARGHIRCSGHARDVAGTGNLLKFELALDQTHLSGSLAQLGQLLHRYPVRGAPAA